MSGAASLTPDPRAREEQGQRAWRVRDAEHADVVGVARAVAALLRELGATPPPHAAMQDVAEIVVENPGSGVLLIAEAQDRLIGLLSASWQIAMHVPGSYGLIQDLWVARAWRGQAVGASLVRAFEQRARALGVSRLEVGLPKETYARLEATSAFYSARGFEPLGPRMRRLIA